MTSPWQKRGETVVNAGIDFLGGVGTAFKGVGKRLKRGKYTNLIEAFCAVAGDVASQNGRFLPKETEGFKRFILDNHDNPFIHAFSTDELLEKFKGYAIAAFLGEEEALMRALKGIEISDDHNNDEGKIVILGALAVAFADGDCDEREADCIAHYARLLHIDLNALAQEFRIAMPQLDYPTPRQSPELPPPPPELMEKKPLCKRCWSFLIANHPQCDCGRDLTQDYAVK